MHRDDDVVYVIGDADRVRDRLDALLFAGDLATLKTLSTTISRAITALASCAVSRMGGEVIVAGGDDILLRLPLERFNRDVLEELRVEFGRDTGCTLSIGAAADIDRAYISLRRAKSRGGDTIVLA